MNPRFQDLFVNPCSDREINYLRLSITDRCNLRCLYCLPRKGWEKLPAPEILRYEEFLRLARVAVMAGIRKVRVTGGEPLVRRGVVDFLRALGKTPGLEKVALTTNGVRLFETARMAPTGFSFVWRPSVNSAIRTGTPMTKTHARYTTTKAAPPCMPVT